MSRSTATPTEWRSNVGRPVSLGRHHAAELLHRLHIDTARALVVTMSDHAASDRLVATARAERPNLLIMVRARDARHAAHLYAIGATDAVPETVEASLQLAEAVLVEIGVPMGPVIATIHERRAELQAEIKAMAPQANVRGTRPPSATRYAAEGRLTHHANRRQILRHLSACSRPSHAPHPA